jgi:hypothetical protein
LTAKIYPGYLIFLFLKSQSMMASGSGSFDLSCETSMGLSRERALAAAPCLWLFLIQLLPGILTVGYPDTLTVL